MSKDFIWPIVGFAVVSVAVCFSFIYQDLWLGFFVALTAGVGLLLIMTVKMLSGVKSAGIKKTVGFLFLGLSVLVIYDSVFEMIKSDKKSDILVEIRQSIDGNVSQIQSEKIFVERLRYKSQNEEVENLAEAFRTVAGDRLKADGTLLPKPVEQGQDLNFSANIVNPDSIVITIVADIARGQDLKYSNSDGSTGKYEGIATLSENGVDYVRIN
ncbi:hypothetical protein [Gracilimonas sp.]|uniref:hypothetical protein n=1 Tax=Gracilimonas sp. TaxID=1974203 RepID=UPI00287182BD|nr:hypothetical protein [Gracilimonas sp.]